MKIHAIQTGTVSIKTRQVEGVGAGSRRRLNMFLDRQWTEPLPIYAFAIEHPTQELMLRGVVDGPSTDDAVARLTHQRIRAFSAEAPNGVPGRTRPGDGSSARRAAGRRGALAEGGRVSQRTVYGPVETGW
jgi:hypothetical protein